MARFNAATYDPASDSSKGHEQARKQFDGISDTVVLIVGEGECPDGCGAKPQGKNRTFRQGHDARLKGILIRAGATSRNVTTITGDVQTTETPLNLAKKYGFSGQVKDGIEREQAKAKTRQARQEKREQTAADKKAAKAAKKATTPKATGGVKKGDRFPIKVGRWTKEGEVLKVSKGIATLQYDTSHGTAEIDKPVAELTGE